MRQALVLTQIAAVLAGLRAEIAELRDAEAAQRLPMLTAMPFDVVSSGPGMGWNACA